MGVNDGGFIPSSGGAVDLSGYVQKANNLSDLANAGTARTNLGLGTAATLASSAVAQTANNGSDFASAATTRTNLGLGTAATQSIVVFAVPAAGQTLTVNSTTLQDLTGFAVPVSASSTEQWMVFFRLIFNEAADTTEDLKFGWTVPSGTTLRGGPNLGSGTGVKSWGFPGSASTPTTLSTQADNPLVGTGVTLHGVSMDFVVLGGGTSGNVQLQAAQNTATAATTLNLVQGSQMFAIKTAA